MKDIKHKIKQKNWLLVFPLNIALNVNQPPLAKPGGATVLDSLCTRHALHSDFTQEAALGP